MDTTTLVLSASFEPIHQIGWQRAITLLFTGRIEVLAEYEDRVVRSPSRTVKVPAVIRFLTQALIRRRGLKFSKENVYARDKGRCGYCGLLVPFAQVTLDHVLPRTRGGTTRWENIVVACFGCNQNKRDRTPEQAGKRLLVTPEKPRHLPEAVRLEVGSIPALWRPFLACG
jgi:5-methylcytosine-specific restriction endonuclease McrA